MIFGFIRILRGLFIASYRLSKFMAAFHVKRSFEKKKKKVIVVFSITVECE